jgi:DNA-binding NarL/FixJ family response regulator
MSDQVRIVLIDDHPLFREGVAHILNSESDLHVIAEGDTAEQAISLIQKHQPDLLLLDLDLPGDGLTVVSRVAAISTATRIVILTASSDEENAIAAFRAGVHGYILKGVGSRELVSILRSIYAGKGYVPPSLGAVLISGLTAPQAPIAPQSSPFDELTSRERQILLQIAAGLSNKEIGSSLSLTEKTVKYYVSSILLKLQVRNRVEAALLAQKMVSAGSQ